MKKILFVFLAFYGILFANNIYSEDLIIGTQLWTPKNLDVDHYQNGDPIPQVTNPTEWANLTTGAWCYYNNDSSYGAIYGKLYNWYAVVDPRGLAPEGYHVPSDAEWTILSNSLGGLAVAGGKLKDTGTTYWTSPNTGATNESGFTALPGGIRVDNGNYYSIGNSAYWWTSTSHKDSIAWRRYQFYNYANLGRNGDYKVDGFSVRCVKDLTIPILSTINITNLTQTSASTGGNITNDGGISVIARGVCWSTSQNPTIDDNKTNDGTGIGIFTSSITGLQTNITYYVRAYATNNLGTAYGDQKSFTIIEVIEEVTIGTQVWKTKNLNVTNYRNGDSIPQVKTPAEWASLTTGAWCYHNNDPANDSTYGKLYNWYAVNDPRGLAPNGWHVPDDTEWSILTTNLGGSNVAGGKMKDTGTTHWNSPNTGATNESGFTAMSGGYCFSDGYFGAWRYDGHWWSSTEFDGLDAWGSHLYYDTPEIFRFPTNKVMGFSVRCLKDLTIPEVTTTNISNLTQVSVSSGGNIINDGGINLIARGVCWSTSVNPTIDDNKTNDGTDIGSYTSNMTNLTSNTTYFVRAYATNSVGTAYGDNITFKTPLIQQISLNSGWNLISSNVVPDNTSIPLVWNEVKENVVIVKNNAGDTYIPTFEIDQIINWNISEGYQVYLTQADTLFVTGLQVVPENTPINLNSGWNIISYLRNSELDCETAFASITDNGNVVIVKDNFGNTYIPAYDINSIGNLIPGQGYQIYVLNPDELIYPEN